MGRKQLALRAAVVVAQIVLARRVGVAVKDQSGDTAHFLLSRIEPARALYRQLQAEAPRSDKVTLSGLPRPLRWLIERLIAAIGEWFADLMGGDRTLAEWYEAMRDGLADYHLAALMAGNGSEDVSEAALARVADQVSVQLDYLNGFRVELQEQSQYDAGAKARAESYAAGIKVPYWTGRTKVLPLPAMPAQGTQCLNNCKCRWDVKTLDEAKGDYDAFWVRHAEDSCQTCLEREAQWSPVRIRDGMLE